MTYSFLELLTESQALTHSSILSDNVCYHLFRNIYKNSTMSNASQNTLFSLEDSSADNMTAPAHQQKIPLLKRLVEEKLVSQIFRLEYTDFKLNLVSCYFALTPKIHPFSIYKTVLNTSIASIEAMLKDNPLDAPKLEEVLKKDLEEQESMQKEDPGILLDPFSVIRGENFDFPPPQELIAASISEMRIELLQRERVIDIPGYNLIPLREEEIVDRFKIAEAILKEKVIPFYKKQNPSLVAKIQEISLRNSISQLAPMYSETTDFTYLLANAIREIIYIHTGVSKKAKDIKYPGALTVNIVLALNEKAKAKLEEKYKRKCMEKYNEIRQVLLLNKNNWRKGVLFLKEKEYNALPHSTQNSLKEDPSIAMGSWEMPEETIWVFMNLDMESIFNIVEQMAQEPFIPNWQVLAVRHLIEIYESVIHQLFKSTKFLEFYGIILRRVYIDRIPWFLRFLLNIKIKWLVDYLYKTARNKIRKEQIVYRETNQVQSEKAKLEKEKNKQQLSNKLETTTKVNKILSALDIFYFQKRTVPTIENIQNYVQSEENDTIASLIQEYQFQVIPSVKNRDKWEDSLLVYPKDYHWPIRCADLKKLAEQVLDSQYVNQNEEMRKRFKRLLALVQKDILSANKEIIAQKTQQKEMEQSHQRLSKLVKELKVQTLKGKHDADDTEKRHDSTEDTSKYKSVDNEEEYSLVGNTNDNSKSVEIQDLSKNLQRD